ncbi:class I adenylate-forming enzyme family protein [Rhabdothermincola salaria]|uniref:class I adenylate-forming enzyme family protein n=1 Tax=Rhabdothermincola salaria TaxID=2903142 RepID=UPI001E3D99D9|nr:class I adenylate-forming enzyme family protein [Rhabdothermincola salaria]MCD9624079.1 acyl--CoA ligase [Rhabdothermincola salaria]
MTEPARLTWQGAAFLSDDARERLLGEGAPFEIVVEDVLGAPAEVYAQRMPNLRAAFENAVEQWGDLPLLVDADTGRTQTFAETLDAAYAVARLLADEYGIEKGDRVAVVAANCPEYLVVAWGVLSMGAILTGLNGWWTGPEMVHGIELTSPKVVTGDERRLARLDELEAEVHVPIVEIHELVERAVAGGPGTRPDVDLHEDDPAIILFTSGTTGRPKGATLTHRGFLHFGQSNRLSAAVAAEFAPPADPDAGPRPQPATIMASPMFHISGLVATLIGGPQLGNKLVFPPPGRWEEKAHLDLTVEHGITNWSGVPTQFWRLLQYEHFDDYDLTGVTSAGGGGAVFPPELFRLFREKMPWIGLGCGYGMSESCGMGTGIGGPLLEARPEAVGIANPTTEVEVRDPSGRPLPEDEVGEVHLRHASIFRGYWNNDEATADSLDDDRWYSTGDFGRITDGMLVLESRMRDLIIRGGENIYPIEIENRLVEHHEIDDAAVIGVDHQVLGQEVKAFVVRRPDSGLTEDDVKAWVAEALAKYKVPEYVEFRDALPYNQTGKLLKNQLEKEEAGEG